MTTPAGLIAPGDFWGPFERFRYTMYRLEVLQGYGGSGEDDAVAAFAAGQPEPPMPAMDRWASLISTGRAAGKVHQRVHVVTEPLTMYMGYEIAWAYRQSTASGEDIRILPVNRGEWPADIPRDDYWLFDSSELFLMHYDASGMWLGAELITDPARIVAACRDRDAAWHEAIPWRQYVASRPQLASRVAG